MRRLAAERGGVAVCWAGGVDEETGAHEALGADNVVSVVLLDGVLGVGEAVESVKDVLEDLDIDVASPEEVEMLVMRNLGGDGLGRQLTQHAVDVDEGVAAAIDEDDGRADVARRVLGHLGELARGRDADGLVHVVVVELEGTIANDLEPVDDGLGAGEGVEMRVGGELLAGGNIERLPVEEERQAHVDGTGKEGRVHDGLPGGRGAQDGAPAKHEVECGRRGFHERIDDTVG